MPDVQAIPKYLKILGSTLIRGSGVELLNGIANQGEFAGQIWNLLGMGTDGRAQEEYGKREKGGRTVDHDE